MSSTGKTDMMTGESNTLANKNGTTVAVETTDPMGNARIMTTDRGTGIILITIADRVGIATVIRTEACTSNAYVPIIIMGTVVITLALRTDLPMTHGRNITLNYSDMTQGPISKSKVKMASMG